MLNGGHIYLEGITMKCDKCGNDKPLLLTRQNPKGQAGIFHCENCTGTPVSNSEEALKVAIVGGKGVADGEHH